MTLILIRSQFCDTALVYAMVCIYLQNDSQNENMPFTRVTRYAKHSMLRQHMIERSRKWRQRQADNSNFPKDIADDSVSPFITRLHKYKTDDTEI